MFGVVIIGVIAACSLWVYLDATSKFIGKQEGEKGFFNLSAGGWATVTLLLWVVGFPGYLIKRAELTELARHQPVKTTGRAGKALLLFVVGLLWFSSAAAAYLSGDLPSCEAPEVLALADKILREQPAFAVLGVGDVKLTVPAEVSYEPEEQVRLCRGFLRSSAGEEAALYTVEWHDRQRGMILVEFVAE